MVYDLLVQWFSHCEHHVVKEMQEMLHTGPLLMPATRRGWTFFPQARKIM